MTIVHSEGVVSHGDTKRDADVSHTMDRVRPIARFIELPDLRRLHPAGKADFPARLRDILSAGPLDTTLAGKPGLEHEWIKQATSLAARAYPSHATT
ncbi:MAG: hypothetical protein ACR2G6_14875, partial [Gemmatimonadaceae bacterium]